MLTRTRFNVFLNHSLLTSLALIATTDSLSQDNKDTYSVASQYIQIGYNGTLSDLKKIAQSNVLQPEQASAYGDFTTLHSAADSGNLDIVKYLLSKGMDPNIRDFKGRTPLHMASKSPEVATYLLNNGADPTIRGGRGWVTPMFNSFLRKRESADVAKMAIETARILKQAELRKESTVKQTLSRFEHSGVHSLEQLLASLPNEYRGSFILGYESRSLQEASDTHPRTILFGGMNDPILAFNGNPHHLGYNSLELIQFNHGLNQFEFREIEFDPTTTHPAKWSSLNPESCRSCHQKEPGTSLRPNWNPYFGWRGFFGSNDDRFTNRGNFNQHTRDPEEERLALINFISSAPGPRYQHLVDLNTRYVTELNSDVDKEIHHEPNSELTALLHTLNATRIASEVSKSKGYSQLRYLIQGIFLGCINNPDTWLDLNERIKLASVLGGSIRFKSFIDYTNSPMGKAAIQRLVQLGYRNDPVDTSEESEDSSGAEINGDVRILTQLLYLDYLGSHFTQNGKVLRSWPMRIAETDAIANVNLNDGSSSADLDDIGFYLALDIDPNLKDDFPNTEVTCDNLRKKNDLKIQSMNTTTRIFSKNSQQPLRSNTIHRTVYYSENQSAQELIALNCMKCHDGKSKFKDAPFIPFGKNSAELRSYLLGQEGSNFLQLSLQSIEDGSMPKGHALRSNEKVLLVNYLKKLLTESKTK